MSNRRFEDRIAPAEEMVTELVYGQSMPIFTDTNIVIIPNDRRLDAEIPRFTQTRDGTQLQLSAAGAYRWADKLSIPCEAAEINPLDLYISSAVAQLELLSAAQFSLSSNSNPVLSQRVMKTYKMVEQDREVRSMASEIGEKTEISVDSILSAFNYEELIKLNMLRYGIGVALVSLGLRPKGVKQFSSSAKDEAILSLNNYFEGAAQFLLRHAMPKEEIVERVDEVIEIEPPLLEIAAAAPMNVTHLFDRHK
jgi:hypothetical protein